METSNPLLWKLLTRRVLCFCFYFCFLFFLEWGGGVKRTKFTYVSFFSIVEVVLHNDILTLNVFRGRVAQEGTLVFVNNKTLYYSSKKVKGQNDPTY